MWVDSHCHLDFAELGSDLDGVIGRARAAGVAAMQTICTRLTEFDEVRRIAEAHDDIHCSVGVHPHNVESEPEASPEQLIGLAATPEVIGIGETGLDYYYDHSPREQQRASFRRHIQAAREAGLPVIVHTRSADEDTIAILREESEAGAFSGVIHCFSAGRAVAEAALELDLYISLSGIITFKAADELREIARNLPLERLLLETDAPYLAPVPKRGKTNEPSYMVHTAQAAAELLHVDLDELARETTGNFYRLFSKASPPGGALLP